MTIGKGINAGTPVSLTLIDWIKLAVMFITVAATSAAAGVWWFAGEQKQQANRDRTQDDRIALVEAHQRKQEADSAAISQSLTRLGDKLESLQSTVADIRAGVARIDERTRGK